MQVWKTDINTEMRLRNKEFRSLIKDLSNNTVDDVRHKIEFFSEHLRFIRFVFKE